MMVVMILTVFVGSDSDDGGSSDKSGGVRRKTFDCHLRTALSRCRCLSSSSSSRYTVTLFPATSLLVVPLRLSVQQIFPSVSSVSSLLPPLLSPLLHSSLMLHSVTPPLHHSLLTLSPTSSSSFYIITFPTPRMMKMTDGEVKMTGQVGTRRVDVEGEGG